jgi:hypothetical protein
MGRPTSPKPIPCGGQRFEDLRLKAHPSGYESLEHQADSVIDRASDDEGDPLRAESVAIRCDHLRAQANVIVGERPPSRLRMVDEDLESLAKAGIRHRLAHPSVEVFDGRVSRCRDQNVFGIATPEHLILHSFTMNEASIRFQKCDRV